jgi:hypothetical protein
LLWIVIVVYRRLFADTKLREDGAEDVGIDVDLASDVAELAHGFADVHGNEVSGGVAFKPFLGAL